MPSARRLAVLALALLCACSAERPEEPRLSGVLITLDTTRVDMLGAFDGPPGLTPALDELARDSIRYERAYSVAPMTLPSHASMLTGLYPPRHGLRVNHSKALPASAATLAERARAAGCQTAAFVAAVVLDESFGLDQGFDVYDAPPRAAVRAGGWTRPLDRKGPEVVQLAVDWLRARDRERPFFLWVHLFDPHMPHEAPPEYLERTRGRPYLAEVAYMDAAVGTLLEELRAQQLLDACMLAVVADHGEALGDHGEPTHTLTCYEATIRVPLLVRPPGGVPGARRVGVTCSIVDLYPTFVRALGWGEPGSVDGADLLAIRPGDVRGAYFESYAGWLNFGWSPLAGWVQGDLKLHATSAPELYDLGADAGEQRNLYLADPARAGPHRRALESVWSRPVLEDEREKGFDEALGADLAALGYVGSSAGATELPSPLEPTDRPSPTQSLGEWRELTDLLVAVNRGETEEGIAGLRRIVAANAQNLEARRLLVRLLVERGEWAEVEQLAREMVAGGAADAEILTALGLGLEGLGRPEEGLAFLQRAADLDRTAPEPLRAVVRVATALGREDVAAAARAALATLERGERP